MIKKYQKNRIDRRNFLGGSTAAVAGFAVDHDNSTDEMLKNEPPNSGIDPWKYHCQYLMSAIWNRWGW